MAYPPPPAFGAPAGKPALRGRTPLRLGILFLIVGIVGVVTGSVLLVNGAFDKVDAFQRVKVPASISSVNTGTVTFTSTGGYIAYYESHSVDERRVPIILIRLTSTSGTQITPNTLYGGTVVSTSSIGKLQKLKQLTYDYHGHRGAAVWQFTIKEAGTYRVEVAGSSLAAADAQMAFGRSIAKSTAAGVLVLLLGILLLIAGVVLLIVGLVKRSHSKKEFAAGAAFAGGYPGGYPPQYGAGYPPPGYPPPGQQPGYPPTGYRQEAPPPVTPPQPDNNPWRPREED